MDMLGGRKFVILLLMLAVGAAVESYHKTGLSGNFVTLMLGLYGAFTAGNVGITIKSLKNGPSQPDLQDTVEKRQDSAETSATDFPPADDAKSQPTLDSDIVVQSLARLEASVGQVVASIPPQNQSLGFLVQAEQRRQMTEITG